jgi:hypothetical protein
MIRAPLATHDAFPGGMLGSSESLPVGSLYYRGSAFGMERRIYLPLRPTRFNVLSSARGPYATTSRRALTHSGGTGILTRFPSPTPFGLGLGPD